MKEIKKCPECGDEMVLEWHSCPFCHFDGEVYECYSCGHQEAKRGTKELKNLRLSDGNIKCF